jgi:hypothetical protein
MRVESLRKKVITPELMTNSFNVKPMPATIDAAELPFGKS